MIEFCGVRCQPLRRALAYQRKLWERVHLA
ncbi:acetyltransferase [Vibrio cholerae]|nr:acetyltransferase [Vibrio cholerae]